MSTEPEVTTEVIAKPWWQSKTMQINILSFIIFFGGLVLEVGGALELSPKTVLILGLVLSGLNGGLRLITNQPLASGRDKTAFVAAPAGTTYRPPNP